MNPSEHLTDIQIAAFNARTLPDSESREVGRHLIGCVNCRGLLPLPDPNNFWTAVMSEKGSDRSQAFSIDSPFRKLAELFSRPGTLAWSTGTLVVILSMSLLILFTVSKESGVESDVVKSIEIENPVSGPNHQNDAPEIVLPQHPESDASQSQPSSRISANRKLSERSSPRPKQDQKTDHNRSWAVAPGVNAIISSTRGTMSKCGAERTFEMQLGSEEDNLVLRWKSVPNATKYHVYVSDDDEILIDEFETEKDTSYLLKKQLDPKRSYKWKVIITLENGQVIVADSQKFTSEDIRSVQKRLSNKKQRSVTRCSVNQ